MSNPVTVFLLNRRLLMKTRRTWTTSTPPGMSHVQPSRSSLLKTPWFKKTMPVISVPVRCLTTSLPTLSTSRYIGMCLALQKTFVLCTLSHEEVMRQHMKRKRRVTHLVLNYRWMQSTRFLQRRQRRLPKRRLRGDGMSESVPASHLRSQQVCGSLLSCAPYPRVVFLCVDLLTAAKLICIGNTLSKE